MLRRSIALALLLGGCGAAEPEASFPPTCERLRITWDGEPLSEACDWIGYSVHAHDGWLYTSISAGQFDDGLPEVWLASGGQELSSEFALDSNSYDTVVAPPFAWGLVTWDDISRYGEGTARLSWSSYGMAVELAGTFVDGTAAAAPFTARFEGPVHFSCWTCTDRDTCVPDPDWTSPNCERARRVLAAAGVDPR